MEYVLEITCRTDADEPLVAADRLGSDLTSSLVGQTLKWADLYWPAAGPARDPFNDDRGAPPVQLMLQFETEKTLRDAASKLSYPDALAGLPAGIRVTVSPFRRLEYPIAGKLTQPADAGFSYVVRYHEPAENRDEFVSNYLAFHPEALATLPRIRNILCYVPLPGPHALPHTPYILGNEVMFDDIEAFNFAMQSNERRYMRENRHPGPKFTGFSTHFPMGRRRIR